MKCTDTHASTPSLYSVHTWAIWVVPDDVAQPGRQRLTLPKRLNCAASACQPQGQAVGGRSQQQSPAGCDTQCLGNGRRYARVNQLQCVRWAPRSACTTAIYS